MFIGLNKQYNPRGIIQLSVSWKQNQQLRTAYTVYKLHNCHKENNKEHVFTYVRRVSNSFLIKALCSLVTL